jgi:hypothetical protein
MMLQRAYCGVCRGTDAADTVVTYLFLYLVPAMGECLAVCVIFLVSGGHSTGRRRLCCCPRALRLWRASWI